MTATFWTGSSLSFTNGSKTVTVNTGPSLAAIKPNSSLKAGNYNEPVEIESVSGSTITLFNNWPGSTGTTSATITPSAATVAAAGVAAQQVITEIQSLVGSASATATANSFVKRDSGGRVKTNTPSANDDAVNKGYLGTAAQKNVGASTGQLMEVGAGGLLGNAETVTDLNGGFGASRFIKGFTSAQNAPTTNGFVGLRSQYSVSGGGSGMELIVDGTNAAFIRFNNGSEGRNGFDKLYHSGNTNFNEFSGTAGNIFADGYAVSSSSAYFTLPINSKSFATSISVVSTFSVRRADSSVVASGLTPVFVNSVSSRKTAVIRLDGLAGMTVGQPLQLRSDTASSSININF